MVCDRRVFLERGNRLEVMRFKEAFADRAIAVFEIKVIALLGRRTARG
jgi:hypothetical protein